MALLIDIISVSSLLAIFCLCTFKFLVEALASFSTSLSFAKVKVSKSSSRERGFVTLSRPVHFTVISSYRQTVWCTCNKKFQRPFFAKLWSCAWRKRMEGIILLTGRGVLTIRVTTKHPTVPEIFVSEHFRQCGVHESAAFQFWTPCFFKDLRNYCLKL